MAAASLPPTALVSMTAEETGGGIQPTTCNLDADEQQNFMSKNGAYKFVFYIPLQKDLIYYSSEPERVDNQCHGNRDEDKGVALDEHMKPHLAKSTGQLLKHKARNIIITHTSLSTTCVYNHARLSNIESIIETILLSAYLCFHIKFCVYKCNAPVMSTFHNLQ